MDRARFLTLALAVCGGVLLGLAGPPGVFPGAEFLVVPGLALLFEVCSRDRGRKLALYIFGVVALGTVAWSLRHVAVVGLVLICVLGGLYMLGLCWVVRATGRGLGDGAVPWVSALVWTAFETVRSHFPWIPYPHGQVSHAFYEQLWLLRPVANVGEAGMNFLVALLAAGGLALLRRRSVLPLASCVLLWGLLSIPFAPAEPVGAPIRVALVQHALPSYADQPGVRPQLRGELAQLRPFAEEMFAEEMGMVDLSVWPESAWGMAGADEPRFLRDVATELGRSGVLLAGGAGRPSKSEPGRYCGAAFLTNFDGDVLGVREKRYRVPIGEFLPPFVAWLRWFFPGMPNVREGRDLPIPALPDGRQIGLLICFENAFPAAFAKLATEGASLFAVVSWEGWYRLGTELDQMLAMSVFRALETGSPVLRATNDGITAIVDGDGRIIDRLPVGRAGILRGETQPSRASRAAVRWGESLAAALLGVLILFGLIAVACIRRQGAA